MSDKKELTEEYIRSIQYFIGERGDITRWCHWEARKELIAQELPVLMAAMTQLAIAERTLMAVVESL